MAYWLYDSRRGVIECVEDYIGESNDKNMRKGVWSGVELFYGIEYGLVESGREYYDLGGELPVSGDLSEYSFWELKTCHRRSRDKSRNGGFVIRDIQHEGILEGWKIGYLLAVVEEIEKDSEWVVLDWIGVLPERVEKKLQGRTWINNPERDYRYVEIPWTMFDRLDPCPYDQQSL